MPANSPRQWPAVALLTAIAGGSLLPHSPLRLPATWAHELGHAVVAWATGGEVVAIKASPDGGETLTRGGSELAILMSGYPAPLLAAAALLGVAALAGRGGRWLAVGAVALAVSGAVDLAIDALASGSTGDAAQLAARTGVPAALWWAAWGAAGGASLTAAARAYGTISARASASASSQ